jgi:hypothetical protein
VARIREEARRSNRPDPGGEPPPVASVDSRPVNTVVIGISGHRTDLTIIWAIGLDFADEWMGNTRQARDGYEPV